MTHHACVLKNRQTFRQIKESVLSIASALDNNAMLDHTREELEGALEQGYTRLKELLGEYLGMVLTLTPESEAINAMIEDYLGDGGVYKRVTDGMRKMAAELRRARNETRDDDTDDDSADIGLSDEARSKLHDQQREQRGHSAHHTNGKLYV